MMIVLHDTVGQAIGFEQEFVRHFSVDGPEVLIVLTDGREVSVRESPGEVAALVSLANEDDGLGEKQWSRPRWLRWPWRQSQKRIGQLS